MKKNKLSLVLGWAVLSLVPGRASAQETQPVYYNTRGGESYQTAVLPPVGKDLKLNHHQKRGQYDYFELDLKAGQTLKASLSVGEKGVEIRPDNSEMETGYPYAGLVVYDAAGNQLGLLDFNGAEKNLQKTIEVDASTPQRIYLLLGSGTGAIHKDYMGFRVDIEDKFDADGKAEAGATIETALALEDAAPGKTYEKNHLTRNDEADFFKIATRPGQGVSVVVTPDNPRSSIAAALYDELRVEMDRERSAAPGNALKLDAKANTSLTYLKINRELSGEPTGYSIRFVAPPPETRPAAETRPLTPETLIPSTPTEASSADEKKELGDGEREKRKKEKDKKSKKTAWWKDPKMLTWGGAGAGGVLILLLGGLILLRKSKKKSPESSHS
ncbi:MAG TPA: hypothetical protein VLJ37_06125 [bacterium]|nr:hypothetical protein [bacterium]